MSLNLSYRLYENKDIDQVLELWKKFSGWGAITEKQFEDWYLKTPYGNCIIIVAVNEENKIVGQEVFIPSVVYINGTYVKALKISAPILNDKYRELNIRSYDHPAFAMYRYGMQIAKERDYEIIYMFPAWGWTSVLKLLPKFGLPEIHIGLYDCFSISLEDENTLKPKSNSLKTSIVDGFTNEYDDLWSEAILNFPINCAVVRDLHWIKWKLKNHLVFESRHIMSNKLQGFIAVNKNTGLIVDMLAATFQSLKNMFNNLVWSIHLLNPERLKVELSQINGMLTPLFSLILQNTLSTKLNFTFAFGCYSLQNKTEQKSIHPENWYMMPND
jgi:hypothetical protein